MEVPPDHHTKPEDAAVDVSTELHRKIASTDVKKLVGGHEDPDETEYSSSFADTTCSRDQNSSSAAASDTEVESQHQKFYGENDVFPSAFDGFSPAFPMRKKRLTNHWRNFITPLMWRCKWAELKIKQFESRASKYARDSTANKQKKHLALDQFTSDDFGSRSLPFTSQSNRRKAMKRRKRKRIEETTDTKSYMLNHILFSYCENKKPDLDGADEFGNTAAITEENTSSHEESNTNNCSFLEDKDDALLVPILRKIDTVHLRVQKLKAKLDSVMSKHAAKFSSSENLSLLVPCDMQTSSVPSPTFSACNGETIPVGGVYAPTQHVSEYDMGDFMMPESAVSSYGDAIPIPDIIESTVGLLTSTVVTQHQSQIGDSCENIVDNILAHNQTAEAEGHTFRQNRYDEPTGNHDEQKSGEEESNNPGQESDTGIKPAVVASQEQSTPKSYLPSEFQFPKNKRKRGERKPGTGGWSRQIPGEPDSQ